MSDAAAWSDGRKRSLFTTGAGAAVTAIPLEEYRRYLREIEASTLLELATADHAEAKAGVRQASRSLDRQAALDRRLDEVRAALQRIDDGSYGICHRCGRPVPLLQLRDVPYTRYCLACSGASKSKIPPQRPADSQHFVHPEVCTFWG